MKKKLKKEKNPELSIYKDLRNCKDSKEIITNRHLYDNLTTLFMANSLSLMMTDHRLGKF